MANFGYRSIAVHAIADAAETISNHAFETPLFLAAMVTVARDADKSRADNVARFDSEIESLVELLERRHCKHTLN